MSDHGKIALTIRGANARLSGHQQGETDGIPLRPYPNPTALVLPANGQAGQEHRRNRALPHPFDNAPWCIQHIDLADGQAEIDRNAVTLVNDKDLGRTTDCLKSLGLRVRKSSVVARFARFEDAGTLFG